MLPTSQSAKPRLGSTQVKASQIDPKIWSRQVKSKAARLDCLRSELTTLKLFPVSLALQERQLEGFSSVAVDVGSKTGGKYP
jgi:hypothetical protein